MLDSHFICFFTVFPHLIYSVSNRKPKLNYLIQQEILDALSLEHSLSKKRSYRSNWHSLQEQTFCSCEGCKTIILTYHLKYLLKFESKIDSKYFINF
ncbi:hypothetical protein BpHYR1_047240 [Brachionus plicatilis]|uniref:Uncharacterized protein n=1 Tax=Brachionus plicatilis TaxID=10195 RepID=A0A3M7QSZ0_BRAPC|nr:hypothetical protein BpHYR1_047240 [Brachionus plicatilis]